MRCKNFLQVLHKFGCSGWERNQFVNKNSPNTQWELQSLLILHIHTSSPSKNAIPTHVHVQGSNLKLPSLSKCELTIPSPFLTPFNNSSLWNLSGYPFKPKIFGSRGVDVTAKKCCPHPFTDTTNLGTENLTRGIALRRLVMKELELQKIT